jgi:hypothetical protein
MAELSGSRVACGMGALGGVQRLAAAEGVVRKSGHSTDTRPKIQPLNQRKKNRNSPGIWL